MIRSSIWSMQLHPENWEEAYKNLGVSQSQHLLPLTRWVHYFKGQVLISKSLELTERPCKELQTWHPLWVLIYKLHFCSVAGAAKGNFTMMDNLGVAIMPQILKLRPC